jgi:hypothetical protein
MGTPEGGDSISVIEQKPKELLSPKGMCVVFSFSGSWRLD